VCVVFVCWLGLEFVPLNVVLGTLGSLRLLSILTIHFVCYPRPCRLQRLSDVLVVHLAALCAHQATCQPDDVTEHGDGDSRREYCVDHTCPRCMLSDVV
jgi:hypothetical protein